MFIPPPAAKARNAPHRNRLSTKPFSVRSIKLITCSALPKGITRRPPGASWASKDRGTAAEAAARMMVSKGAASGSPRLPSACLRRTWESLICAGCRAPAPAGARSARRQTPASTACRGWPPGSRSRRRFQASCRGPGRRSATRSCARPQRLRDGLAETQGQGGVFIGALRQRRLQENVARHRPIACSTRLSVMPRSRRRSTMRARVRCEVMPIPVSAAEFMRRRAQPAAHRPHLGAWVRSICSGVTETQPCSTAWKSVPSPASAAGPAGPIQYSVSPRGLTDFTAGSAL
jgi:hypothetical protein